MESVGDDRSCRLICWVVLGVPDVTNRAVSAWAEFVGMPERVAAGMLISALDRLAKVYVPLEKGEEDDRLGR